LPSCVVVGASLCLFPFPVREVRAIADTVGAYVMYDGAHVAGLIAAGEFQQPLEEGAHLMTCSTYKSFGGPPQGLVLTNSADLARRLDAIAFPGLTANFDLAKTAALVVAAIDLRQFGREYAAACIANARALAEALDGLGCPVHGVAGRGFTMSHHVAVSAARFGGGQRASRRLEGANILTCGIGLPLPAVDGDYNGIRIGAQEITRWGMTPRDMPELADLIARVWRGKESAARVRPDTLAFRLRFQTLCYMR
jgi:glycine hydroxymethyltransferase